MTTDHRCSVMAAYKKHLMRTNNKDLLNAVGLWSDIEKYRSIDVSDEQSQRKKDETAAFIMR